MISRRALVTVWSILVVGMLAVPLVGADDATFNLGSDVVTTGKLLTEMAWNTETPYPYGNWYGPGWWGGKEGGDTPGTRAPVDALDAIAMHHDFAYQIAEEQGKIYGPAEEQRLKAMADAIAVQNAKALPANPSDWDPPAADPATADRYRRRIGFGFSYLSAGRAISSVTQNTLQAISNAFNGKPGVRTSGIGPAELEAMSGQLAKDWFASTKITETYRIAFSADRTVIAEGETLPITVSIVPVSSTASASNDTLKLFSEISLDVDGPGKLTQYLVSADSQIRLTATDPWFGSNVGKTINITGESEAAQYTPASAEEEAEGSGFTNAEIAEGQEYVRSVQILAGSIDFQVALKTALGLTSTPAEINEWPAGEKDPCQEVVLRATLVTQSGRPVEGVVVTFALPDGTEGDAPTDAQGVATYTTSVCESSLGGEASVDLLYRASTPRTTTEDGLIYFPASNGTHLYVYLEAEGGIFTGRVVDGRHGNVAVPGATVHLDFGGESRTATAGSDGSFRVEFSADAVKQSPDETATASVSADGFQPGRFAIVPGIANKALALEPVGAIIHGTVLDAESGEPLDGAIVRLTEPFSTTVEAQNGQFTIQGAYLGDTITISAGAFNHKTYQKTGKLTMEDATITFRLPVGTGSTASGDLDAEETTEENAPTHHALTIWATPAKPGPGQNVTVTAQVFPPEAGIPVKLSIVGTDGYADSLLSMTNAMGQAYLPIPGALSGVVDHVTVLIVGENVSKTLNYSFY